MGRGMQYVPDILFLSTLLDRLETDWGPFVRALLS